MLDAPFLTLVWECVSIVVHSFFGFSLPIHSFKTMASLLAAAPPSLLWRLRLSTRRRGRLSCLPYLAQQGAPVLGSATTVLPSPLLSYAWRGVREVAAAAAKLEAKLGGRGGRRRWLRRAS